ncbi:hypothetical protein ACE2AJ_01745 [Aquihabitans daechungensis]|uniref:hypothetical protein n=1 Tax=Aquihabitans daechungensis TaxID=1052257 RepID=UPI003B9FEBC3
MCRQVGEGRPVSAVASELGCDWHSVMDAVVAYGTPLVDDPGRIGEVTALGLDETLFVRDGLFNERAWVTSIVDVTRPAQLLDVVEDRTAKAPSDWIEARPTAWRDAIRWGVIDLSGPLSQDPRRQPPRSGPRRGPLPRREVGEHPTR